MNMETTNINPIALRIAELIENKTGGSRVLFARQVGWSKQRLTNVLAGKSIGLTAVEDILRAYQDLNARWLIFGDGNMLNITEPNFGKRYNTIKAFERYLPYMTDAEALLLANGKSDWDEATVARWSALDQKRRDDINRRFTEAYARQGMKFKKI